jgi:hypothetical protein
MEFIDIEPATLPKTASHIKIDVKVILGNKAIVSVGFHERNNYYQALETKVIIIENEEYNAWIDDSYLENLIFSKLGITKAPTSSQSVEEEIKVDE